MKKVAAMLFVVLLGLQVHAMDLPMEGLGINENLDLTLYAINVNGVCYDIDLNRVVNPDNPLLVTWTLQSFTDASCSNLMQTYEVDYLEVNEKIDFIIHGLRAGNSTLRLELLKNELALDLQIGNPSWRLGNIDPVSTTELDLSGTWICDAYTPYGNDFGMPFNISQTGNDVTILFDHAYKGDPERQDTFSGTLSGNTLVLSQLATNSTHPDCQNYDGTGEFQINEAGNQMTGSITGHSCSQTITTFDITCRR